MAKLCSVGLDVGTSTTQLVVSELTVENQASGFSVPEMTIGERRILYESPVYFTPMESESLVDGKAIGELVAREYAQAGIRREDVDTGAVIITGETSRKENAAAVLASLSQFAGEFVVATAGPELESILAAKGAGAVAYSEETGKTVLHMDIGGGTSNLAWIRQGRIVETGCLNVGGRLLKLDKNRTVTYVSPVLKELCQLKVGQIATREQVEAVAAMLAEALEMAAALRPPTPLLESLTTQEMGRPLKPMASQVISFSGGVADCIENAHDPLAFGDMGVALGQAIRRSRLCQGQYTLGKQTIRATVIGAGCHSTQLSGSTVFYRNVHFPMKNLSVISLSENLPQRMAAYDGACVVAIGEQSWGGYAGINRLADRLIADMGEKPLYFAMEQDMAKALGQALALRVPENREILCLDRVRLEEGSYLDVAAPVGPALPVVVKTLVLNERK